MPTRTIQSHNIIMINLLLILLFLIQTSAPAEWDERFPFSSNNNVRIISDSYRYGVSIQKTKKTNERYLYIFNSILFSNKEKNKVVKFEDLINYDYVYVPENGDFIFLTSSFLESIASVLIIDLKSGNRMKCNLDTILSKMDLYEHRIFYTSDNKITANIWHKNNWKTIGNDKVILDCLKLKNTNICSFIFYPSLGYVILAPYGNKALFKSIEIKSVK